MKNKLTILLTMVLALMLVFALVSCGKLDDSDTATNSQTETTTETSSETDTNKDTSVDSTTDTEANEETETDTGVDDETETETETEEGTETESEAPEHVHTEESLLAVEPTCKETGLTEGKKCAVCGDVLVEQETVEALGHTEETIPSVEPTCEKEGLTEGKRCSDCGEILLNQEEIPASHTFENSRFCSDCGYESATEAAGLEFRLHTSTDTYMVVGKGTCIDTDVLIPSVYNGKAVGAIDQSAFDGCTELTSVIISEGITSIGRTAFFECTNLTSVEIPNSVTWIGYYAFGSCSGLSTVKIPDSVSVLDEGAFSGCTGMTSLTIGEGLLSISMYAFSNCKALTEINFNAAGLFDIEYTNNEIFYKAGASGDGIKLTIGKNVSRIPNNLFSTLIKSSEAPKIKSIEFEDGSVCQRIGECAFYRCASVESIVIPTSVTLIGGSAFDFCTSISIYCEATEKPSGWDSTWNYSDCPVYWYSETEPTTDGNYWHYVDGVVTIWE